jgi:hypothetical protein
VKEKKLETLSPDVTNFLLDSMQNITGFHTVSRPRFSNQVRIDPLASIFILL